MGNPDRRRVQARQREWAARQQDALAREMELRTIPTWLRIKPLRMALWGTGQVASLTPTSVYLAHLLVREEMRVQQYGLERVAAPDAR